MADQFQVDLDVLQRMTQQLEQAEDQMGRALKLMGEASASSGGTRLGTDTLDQAADHFRSTWEYGFGQLQKIIKETVEGVRTAHDAYQELDQGIQAALKKMNTQGVQRMEPGIDSLAPKLNGVTA